MEKPQHNTRNEEFFSKRDFPQEIDYLLEGFEDNKLLKCDAERMIEIAYKSGYVDAWREALFLVLHFFLGDFNKRTNLHRSATA